MERAWNEQVATHDQIAPRGSRERGSATRNRDGRQQLSTRCPCLDEYTFPFNRRASRNRGLVFYRLLEQCPLTRPRSYETIVLSRRGSRPGARPDAENQEADATAWENCLDCAKREFESADQ